MNSTASLLTAAVSISAGKWKRNEGRLTSDDILQGITDAEEVSAFPKRVIADWAAEVVGKLSNTEPSGAISRLQSYHIVH